MQETIEILTRRPFTLPTESAILLARYIIEDINEEYVYSHFLNENHREVVRSIVKTLIPSYTIVAEVEKEAVKVM